MSCRQFFISAVVVVLLSPSVFGAADLALTKVDTPDPVRVGNSLTYHIAITNRGPDTAVNVVVTDVLPTSLQLISCAPSQGTQSNDGNTVYCDLGNLLNGATAAVVIVTTPQQEGTITNQASISADNGAGGRVSAETVVNAANRSPVIDLPGPHIVLVGASTGFVVSVSDSDHDPLVTLTNTLKPAGATFNGTNFSWTAGVAFFNTTNWIEFVADDHQGETNSVATNRTQLVVPLDGDGDSMDDQWEWNNFQTLTNGQAGDVDADGADNRTEYIAGTQPTNAGSRFAATAARAAAGAGYVISWPTAAARTYDVYRATNGVESLESLVAGLSVGSYTDSVPASPVYYRVKVKKGL